MNKKQMIVLLATAAILLLLLLFPPFHGAVPAGCHIGYRFVASTFKDYAKVNIALLSIQCLIVGAVGGICWVAFKSGKESPERKGKEKGRKEDSP
ncbi:MAG: hypothetical protein JRJ69_01430 [Deltaproteobacteria bacterium]|nr:hypothetical protein [Deltaproteobacteria bacterium]MBW1736228.1 hypothetical protein [Deltaproteobacteria bacterium]MBW1908529.1 hypothetical protein [Deltaproteobacteria bacterium]MBW2032368.1 hypothetical protein [Deltaproteobacteria bacterium]MBW2113583.1 hypothetical protein [Deltaproteobacteria bacterium]